MSAVDRIVEELRTDLDRAVTAWHAVERKSSRRTYRLGLAEGHARQAAHALVKAQISVVARPAPWPGYYRELEASRERVRRAAERVAQRRARATDAGEEPAERS